MNSLIACPHCGKDFDIDPDTPTTLPMPECEKWMIGEAKIPGVKEAWRSEHQAIARDVLSIIGEAAERAQHSYLLEEKGIASVGTYLILELRRMAGGK